MMGFRSKVRVPLLLKQKHMFQYIKQIDFCSYHRSSLLKSGTKMIESHHISRIESVDKGAKSPKHHSGEVPTRFGKAFNF